MKNISSSASKIAFLALMGTACVAFLYEVIVGRATLGPENFMVLASGAAAFYFAYKGNSGSGPGGFGAGGEIPFAGK